MSSKLNDKEVPIPDLICQFKIFHSCSHIIKVWFLLNVSVPVESSCDNEVLRALFRCAVRIVSSCHNSGCPKASKTTTKNFGSDYLSDRMPHSFSVP
ncbi:hypothetical protein HNY73_004267 [Argiope bruennichi]|uniref:Uncharacterized protein n=1 Tax=Argiope bruennichi TaxID=94029 RepID=A0A8T0FND7_ARGBR|nr:hypothetical protein HNY73_004267 [Argiope bruennichi]